MRTIGKYDVKLQINDGSLRKEVNRNGSVNVNSINVIMTIIDTLLLSEL